MKKLYSLFTLIMILFMLCIPIISVKGSIISETPGFTQSKSKKSGENFRLLDSETGKITNISRDEYIFGVVAAEMPALYETEALKAQAVAAYTFALFRKSEGASKDYDISTNSSADQAYIARDAARANWGSKADEYCAKIENAIAAVKNEVIIDDSNNPILAAYHSVSSGKTESSLVVWGRDYSYLQPVQSTCDLLSPDYLYDRSFTNAEFAELMADKVELSGNVSDKITGIERSSSGTITTIVIGGVSFSGPEVRSILSLRSANFEVFPIDGGVKIRTQGYGHGVGMSQFGANYMAKQGSSYLEILGHYYTGCKLKSA